MSIQTYEPVSIVVLYGDGFRIRWIREDSQAYWLNVESAERMRRESFRRAPKYYIRELDRRGYRLGQVED